MTCLHIQQVSDALAPRFAAPGATVSARRQGIGILVECASTIPGDVILAPEGELLYRKSRVD